MVNKVMLLLLLTANALSNGPLAAHAGEIQRNHDSISNLRLELMEEKVYLAWDLLYPSGSLSTYKILWNGEAKVENMSSVNSKPRVFLDYSADIPCFRRLNVTVVPLDKEDSEIGEAASRYYVWKDIVSDINLKANETEDKKSINATWSLKCRSESFMKLKLMSWRDNETTADNQTLYKSASRGETDFTAIWPNISDNECPSYQVKIQPISKRSSVAVASGIFSTFKIQYHQLLATSVRCTWNNLMSPCNVTGYTIHYNGTTLWGDGMDFGTKRVHQQADEIQANIDDLWPYTSYLFCVTAERMIGNELHDCVSFETPQSKPNAPISLKVNAINDTHLQMNWQKPKKMKGILSSYLLQLYGDEGQVGSRNTSETHMIVELDTCISYNISVAAITGAGEGEAAWTTSQVGEDCSATTFTLTETTKETKPNTENPTSPKLGNLTMFILGSVLGVLLTTVVVIIWKYRRCIASFCSKLKDTGGQPAPGISEETPMNEISPLKAEV